MGGVCGNDTEVERGGTQEEGACGVASQEGRLMGSKTEPSRARIRESYENRSFYCEGIISRSRPGPRAISVKKTSKYCIILNTNSIDTQAYEYGREKDKAGQRVTCHLRGFES